VWSEKTTVAEYSVVKEPAVATVGRFGEAGSITQPADLARIRGAVSTALLSDAETVVRVSARLRGLRPLRRGLPSCSSAASFVGEAEAGGEYRARTGDLLVANQALSQLS
jgi:hypothetical protein